MLVRGKVQTRMMRAQLLTEHDKAGNRLASFIRMGAAVMVWKTFLRLLQRDTPNIGRVLAYPSLSSFIGPSYPIHDSSSGLCCARLSMNVDVVLATHIHAFLPTAGRHVPKSALSILPMAM